MRRLSNAVEEEESSIDLTPMLDVVFIMLIFFIVTAAFINERGVEVDRPDQSTDTPPPDQDNPNIVVNVGETDQITIDGNVVDIRAVRARIQQKKAENPDAMVIIVSDGKGTSGNVVRITDQALSVDPTIRVALVKKDD